MYQVAADVFVMSRSALSMTAVLIGDFAAIWNWLLMVKAFGEKDATLLQQWPCLPMCVVVTVVVIKKGIKRARQYC